MLLLRGDSLTTTNKNDVAHRWGSGIYYCVYVNVGAALKTTNNVASLSQLLVPFERKVNICTVTRRK